MQNNTLLNQKHKQGSQAFTGQKLWGREGKGRERFSLKYGAPS